MPHSTTRRPVVRLRADGTTSRRPDTLAVEEPLEIRLDGQAYTVTMRTPGHDLDLALGFLVAEGVITKPDDVVSAMHCPDAARDADGQPTYNVVDVALGASARRPDAARHRSMTSACGICGTETIEAVRMRSAFDVAGDDVSLDPGMLLSLPDRLREGQAVFGRTGGVHAAGLFTAEGELLCVREDVGRHNALDKVVGHAFGAGLLPLRRSVIQVSGRASFELVQKAWAAGCPVLAAVSAPSSLAVELADEAGMTLAGFSRGGSANVYAGAHRLATAAPA